MGVDQCPSTGYSGPEALFYERVVTAVAGAPPEKNAGKAMNEASCEHAGQ